MLKINEIFHSIQGESSKAGLPCTFIRLTGCNLRCSYCDTAYAFYDGESLTLDEICQKTAQFGCNLVEVTGGEPLLQDECHSLLTRLCDEGYSVMIETGGSFPINRIDTRVMIILDMKTPSSGMEKKNIYRNLDWIKPADEVKFVIGSRQDYEWSRELTQKDNLPAKTGVLFSPVYGSISNEELAGWILQDKLNVRFQIQMQKYIWHPDKRGV